MAPNTEASSSAYRLLLAAVILIPAVLAAAFAWWNWDRVNAESHAGMSQRVDMLYENALRLFQTDELLLDRIDDRVRTMSWSDITAHKGELSDDLGAMAAGVREVDAAT